MKSWKVKEIVIMSVISIVFAIVYLVFTHFGNVLAGMFGPIAYEPIYGIWFIVSVIAAYIIRKPGAALVSEVIAALVECLLGNPSGPMVIVIGVVQGLGAEAVFLATRWKAYSLPVLLLAGMGSSVASFIYDLFVSGYAAYSPGYLLIMLVIRLVSGAVLAGLLGKAVSDSLAYTGVLNGMALGKELKKKRKRVSNHASL
ncbi:ECF transporter S component [Bacillus mojavensis]|jgi:energy-coupling factor transport system substrate-specific component|uniref:ECF transporter S component n=1 Tax=Bacillus mojavensis TaxID=72360 RepID=A0AAP3FZ56_BACMO|nr:MULTISPECIES: ECF transporter S component [Bacillus]MCC2929566.1 ECF transporter S component [Bacillus sp. LBG-1-113]MCY8510175.1 ECF transporter S component [Bacillus mojavensis]MCY9188690.1 ECF transporter S component [Bacillus mojavensis]MEC1615361.1 ECF transporter S component [Bacillus mojavensis]MEC1620976.1 ECF transporter S component [Bacillus mojavensis]